MISEVNKPKPAKPPPGNRNKIRIIGGSWRGRRVSFPDTPGLRPTPDRVRETLFNWLQPSIVESRCLDLFAGSGALGLEALSRGAREVVFVEKDPLTARALQAELTRLGGHPRARVMELGAARFLRVPGEPFDVVFLDPPFGIGALAEYVPAARCRRLGEARRFGVSGRRTGRRRARIAAALGAAQSEVGGRGGVSFGAS